MLHSVPKRWTDQPNVISWGHKCLFQMATLKGSAVLTARCPRRPLARLCGPVAIDWTNTNNSSWRSPLGVAPGCANIASGDQWAPNKSACLIVRRAPGNHLLVYTFQASLVTSRDQQIELSKTLRNLCHKQTPVPDLDIWIAQRLIFRWLHTEDNISLSVRPHLPWTLKVSYSTWKHSEDPIPWIQCSGPASSHSSSIQFIIKYLYNHNYVLPHTEICISSALLTSLYILIRKDIFLQSGLPATRCLSAALRLFSVRVGDALIALHISGGVSAIKEIANCEIGINPLMNYKKKRKLLLGFEAQPSWQVWRPVSARIWLSV